MANEIGSTLVIDDKFLKSLTDADDKIAQLAKTSENTSKIVNQSFKDMANGVAPFIEELKRANEAFMMLGKTGSTIKDISGVNKLSAELANTRDSAEKTANSIVKVMNSLSSFKDKLKSVSELDTKIKNIDKGFNTLVKTAWSVENKVVSSIRNVSSNISTLVNKVKDSNKNLSELGQIDFKKSVKIKGIQDVAKELRYLREEAVKTHQVFTDINKEISKIGEKKNIRNKKEEYKNELNNYKEKLNYETQIAKIKDQIEKKQASLAKLEQASVRRSGSIPLGSMDEVMKMDEETMSQRIAKIKQLKMARLSLSNTDAEYNNKLNQLNSSIKRLNNENNKAIASSKNLENSQRNLLNTSSQLMRKMALIFSVSQVAGYITKLIEVRGEFEMQNVALAAILQNKAEANHLFNQITELAVKSPFQLKELVTYTKQLAAYRVESEKLYDTTKMLADVSAGLGVGMDRLILAYGQVKAANYLRGTELRQFSEAGINILGELSTYFSELEGRMISVGDVFEMVSNRMVKFSDVEVIFKRLTSAGGIFYNMQELRANTLKGQLSNLQDSLDVMFNEIGQANEGVLKNAVSLVRKLIESWSFFTDAIKAAGIGLVFYGAKALWVAAANNTLSLSAVKAALSTGVLGNALNKTITIFSKVGAFAKGNIWTIIVSGLALLTYRMVEFYKGSKKASEAYDVLTESLGNSRREAHKTYKAILSNNSALKDISNNTKDIEEGTKEYIDAQEESNRLTKDNISLLNKLKKDHPEIYAGITLQKDGTIDLYEAQEKLNKELSLTNYLNSLAKEKQGLFSDGVIKQIQTLEKDQKAYNVAIGETEVAYTRVSNNLDALFSKEKGIPKETVDSFKSIMDGSESSYEKLRKIMILAEKETGRFRVQFKNIAELGQNAFTSATRGSERMLATQEELAESFKDILEEFSHSLNLTTEEGVAQAERLSAAFLKSMGMQDEEVKKFVKHQFAVNLGIFIPDPKSELDGIYKKINQYIKDHKIEGIRLIDAADNVNEYFDNIQKLINTTEEEIQHLSLATVMFDDVISNAVKKEELEEKLKKYKELMSVFGRIGDSDKNGGKKTALDTLKEQIKLIEKVNSEYEKLLKNYDKESAKAKVKQSYEDLFKEVGLGDMILSMDFDKAGAIKAIKDLKNIAGKEGNKELLKSLSELQATVELDVQVSKTDALQEEIANLFGGYELSVELDKIEMPENISKALAEQFGFKYISMDDLISEIDRVGNELKTKFGDDGVKAWQDAQKKIADINNKAIKDRMVEYSKYLEQTKSERIKVEEEMAKKIAAIEKESLLNDDQKKVAKENIQKEGKAKIAKIDWEELKGLDLYRQSFEDVERLSTSTLNMILANLEQFAKESGQALDASGFKELMSNIKKIRSETESRNPFGALTDGIREYKEALHEIESAQREFDEALVSKNEAQSKYDNAPINEQAEALNNLTSANENLAIASDKLAKAEDKKAGAFEKVKLSIENTRDQIELIRQAVDEAINAAYDLADGLGMTFSPETEAIINSIGKAIGIVVGALTTVAAVMITVNALMMAANPLMWALVGAAAALAAVFAIIAIGDKKKEKKIKKEQENVEKLEKAYRKLEKAIQDAYSIDNVKASNEAAQKNIDAQIASYQKMIAFEKDKKKTDKGKVKEWEDKIEELRELQEKLNEDFIAELGGFGSASAQKSAAQEFVDAWKSAFDETGDGLSGLEDKMNDFLDNAVKKQLLLRLSDQYIKPVLDSFDKMFDKYSPNGEALSKEEIDAWKKLFEENAQKFDEEAKKYLEMLGLAGGKGGELSGLQKGIQSVTEETAQALEALLNSVRFICFDTNTITKNIYAIFSDNTGNINPMLAELRLQTKILSDIRYTLKNVVKSGHPTRGGDYVSVFM